MPDKLTNERTRRSRDRGAGVRVNAYYGGRKNEEPTKEKAKRKISIKRRLAIISLDGLSLVVLIGFLIYSLFVSPHAKLAVDDTTYHPLSYYQSAINSELRQFKNRNKITFDDAALKADIEKKFPEVQRVSVELPVFGADPKVSLSVGHPKFTLESQGQKYLISGNGTAVGLIANYKIKDKLIPIIDNSGYNISAGQQVLSSGDIAFIETLISQLNRKRIPVKQLILPQAPEEIDLYTTDEGFYTKFFLGGDADLQAGQYLAARSNWGGDKPSSYLDVRVAGKIFYK